MSAVVEVRYAGGPVIVETEESWIDEGRTMVVLTVPGVVQPLAMFPAEAHSLARALVAAAISTDAPVLRRSSAVDAEFLGRES